MGRFTVELSTIGGGLVIEVPGPERATTIKELAQWQKSDHGAGGLDGFRRTLNAKYEWTIDLPNLGATGFIALEEFFLEVNGNADEWLYTHTDDKQYTVRFWSQPQYRRENSEMYAGSIIILSNDRPQETSP